MAATAFKSDEIVPNQPYTDFHDYFERAGKGAGKGVVEAGIKIGAFESIPLIVDKTLLIIISYFNIP